jgi:hypothetical protein
MNFAFLQKQVSIMRFKRDSVWLLATQLQQLCLSSSLSRARFEQFNIICVQNIVPFSSFRFRSSSMFPIGINMEL